MKRGLIYILLISLLFTSQSCKKELLDINKNPNSPSAVGVDLVLPAALSNTAFRLNNAGFRAGFDFSALWMGYMAYSGNFAISTPNISYKFTTAFEGGIWTSTYKNISDYLYIEKKAAQSGDKFYEGSARIMKALEYQNLVDIFNNIPYSDGGRGAEGVAYLKPKYDDAKTVYEDLIKQIDTGIALIKTSISAPSSSIDLLFGGNKNLWAKFGNTLKLRMLLHQSEMAGRDSYIQSEIAKITAEGSGFLGAGQTAFINPGYSNSAGKMNPWWSTNYDINGTYANTFYVANQYAIDFYKDNKDPRLGQVYSKNPQGSYVGNFFGDQGIPNSGISFFGKGTLKSVSQPSVLFSSWESLFLQAEASLRGWISGDAKGLLNAGITESFKYLEVTDAVNAANTYNTQLGNKEVNYDACTTAGEKLALIIRQKWAANNNISVLEAWNDYRRLKLPVDIPLSKSPFAASTIPVRLLYPQSEYDYNPENVQGQGTIDQFTSKIFWIK